MATAAGTTASARRQKQQAALFKAKHEELLAEARGVAFEFGVNRVVDSVARAVARDVSAMGLQQAVEHQRKLRQLRALVARELQVREAKAKDDAAAAPAAAAGASKRALEQQEMMMAAAGGGGSNKIRRTG
ncbi:hypothetical protein BS78_07G034500 [Paspalum vaginatum]|nr:hypothetical protein BS78_07G034500 [Paspalum vaginatum]